MVAKAEKAVAVKNGNQAVAKSAVAGMLGDVRQGGLSGSDFEIPRVLLLQKTSPDVDKYDNLKAGLFINNITKEILPDRFIPLFAFKQYAEFTKDGKLVWSTMDRNDKRVVIGLEWGNSGDPEKDKPTATEFINFMVVIEGQAMPLVLSFKRTAFKIGKQFLTLTSMKPGMMYSYSYLIDSLVQQKGSQSWYIPKIVIPSEQHVVSEELQVALKITAEQWRLMVGKISVQEEANLEEVPF